MKKLFNALMRLFKKPITPLSIEEIESICKQLIRYQEEVSDCMIQTSFSKTMKQMIEQHIRKTKALHRMSELRIKLLKSCDCGATHLKDIESEKTKRRIYTERLLKYCDEN